MSKAKITDLRAASHAIAKDVAPRTLAEFFKSKKSIIAQALPKHMTPERILRVAVTAINTTPALAECSLESLAGAVVKSSILGLEPNTPLGHAHLVPFWNAKKGIREVQLIIGFQGFLALAYRSGQVSAFCAHTVYEGDEYEFEYGLHDKLRHVPARSNRGEIIAAYAIAKLKNADPQFEWLWIDEINKIRDQSKGAWYIDKSGEKKPKLDSPWWVHPDPMARKSAVRRLAKYLPLSIEFFESVKLDSLAAEGESQGLEDVIEMPELDSDDEKKADDKPEENADKSDK